MGRRRTRTADKKSATPAIARPPLIPLVPVAMAPMTDGPTKPPRFPTELMKAMPAADENPARNLLGIEKNGPKKGNNLLDLPNNFRHT